jgi:hypothetical protein
MTRKKVTFSAGQIFNLLHQAGIEAGELDTAKDYKVEWRTVKVQGKECLEVVFEQDEG